MQQHMRIILFLPAICLLLIIGSEIQAMQKPKHVVLLGASVGKAWNIESLPKRISQLNPSNSTNPSNPTNSSNPTNPSNSSNPTNPTNPSNPKNPSNPTNPTNSINYRFEYIGEYQFDKSKALQQILQRKENKPHVIFIKECAAYFPGNLPQYEELMKGWVIRCKETGVIPIPTTVVPVIKDLPLKTRLKDLIKWVIGRPTQGAIHTLRLKEILLYNDWIKSYARKEGLIVLDLEAPLHIDNENRSLRLDLHSGDGLHLNEKAYAILDKIVIPTLEKAFDKKY